MDMFYKESLQRTLVQQQEHTQPEGELKLFVGGLNQNTTEQVLFQYFSQFGDVSHVEIARSPNHKSKGYGYVNFKTQKAKKNALEVKLHCLQSNNLRVEPAFHQEYRAAQHSKLAERRLYLSGIPSNTPLQMIQELLEKFGHPTNITSLRRSNPYSNPNSFYCYVTMDRP